MGVTVPVETAGIVVGVVERKSSARPVSVLPLISSAVAESGCVLFWLTVTLVRPPVLGTFSVMETGGQVEKNPADEPAWVRFALMTVEPGCCAVATPFSSIVTTHEL